MEGEQKSTPQEAPVNNKNPFYQEKTRRQFLEETGQAGLAILLAEFTFAGGSLGALFKMLDSKLDAAKAEAAVAEAQAGTQQINPPTATPASPVTTEDQTQNLQASTTTETLAKSPSLVEQLFAGCTDNEKKQAAGSIKKQIEAWKTHNIPFADFTKELNEQLKTSLGWREKINECVKNLEAENDLTLPEFIPQLLPALIFVESKGNPKAKSGANAYGLCQLLMPTAQEVARDIGLKGNLDLLDPETNIKLSMAYLNKLYQLYPDPSLIFWSYYFGIGNVQKAVKAFTGRSDLDMGAKDEKLRPRTFVKNEKLTFPKLVSDDRVKNWVRPLVAQDGEILAYVIKIAAAASLMDNLKD